MGQQLRRCALFDDASVLHDGSAVGDVAQHADIVRDEEHRCAVLVAQGAQDLEHLPLERGIECRGRFVGEQEARPQGECECYRGALRHPARQCEGIGVEDVIGVSEAHAAQELCRALRDLRICECAVCPHRLGKLCPDAARRIQ